VVQEIWSKFNANERLAAIGAIVILVSFIIGLVSPYGIGASTIALLGALAVLAVLYLKYAPNQTITWPAPVPVILLAISGVVGLLELIDLLRVVQVLGSFGGTYLVAVIGTVVGAAIMLWGSYQEWQSTKSPA